MAPHLRQLAPKVARLSAFVMLLMVGLHLLLGRMVRAQTESSLLELGAGLSALGPATDPGGGPRVLELNGARVQIAVEATDRTVEAVLDGAAAGCSPAGERTLRGGDGGRGFVACAVPAAIVGPVVGEAAASAPSYRYVYAQPGEGRGALEIAVTLDGSIDPAALFPAEGDAPGIDAPGLPRPPSARRLLSARELGLPQQITMYVAGDREPAELEAWYRARLPALGWRALDGERQPDRPRVLLAERAGSLSALVFGHHQATGGASVLVLTSLDEMEQAK